jgi:hypothetical protein
MARRVTGRDGLDWRIKRLVVPTGFKPMSRTELLDTATPRRTSVEGMDRRVPDAFFAPTGPLPLGFLFFPFLFLLPLVPLVLLLRRLRILRWTVEARTHPWGRRYPPIVLTYVIRGGLEALAAVDELEGAVKIRQQASPHHGIPVVTHGGKRF